MHRTRAKVVGVVATLAAVGLLAACGNNDSTAKSTPTLAPTTSKAAASAPATPSAEAPSGGQSGSSEAAAPTSPAPVERPQPVPSQYVTTPSNATPLTDKDKTFLEELKKKGITPASTDIALTAGNLVCQGKAGNAPEDQIITYVTAIAGSDPSFDESKMPVEQAGKIYYEVASSSYCK
ncbi:DUF732 domain-containing protein [Nocardia yamanashiensis]|uniref:DUF732 domain-containing protein n=1 Tax=Nocardia yamanashiensis TaxID=209247 RepID=UPI001E2949B7|nr:DUF732 domain-containing protein [Nocardia yamanashiensis]UGT40366.1 DUF732 domain-containing protein [Nocardia yamanashiensis]